MDLAKPGTVLDRVHEWELLRGFLIDPAPQLRLAIVSGRRRHGKSFLLQALTRACGGLYLTAVQEEGRIPALRRFTEAIAAHAGLPAGALQLTDWREVLTTALEVAGRTGGAPLVVVDELPYLMQHSPEVPGFLQLIYDQSQAGQGPGGRMILCGSAMSVMSDLLTGTKPLRGRAVVDLRLGAFDFRTARRQWEIEDPATAFRVDAVVGGAPGYRPLAPGPAPAGVAEFGDWVCRTLLDPGRALYTRVEAEFLLREDPRITHRTLYYDLLTAVSEGASTPSKIGAVLERPRASVVAPLEVLESTGYLRKSQDLLKARNPVITVIDPIIRLNQLVTLPFADEIERGRAGRVWAASQPTVNSKILGPHFEELAREWTRSFGQDETGSRWGLTGAAEVADPRARTRHEVDVLALTPGQRPQAPRAGIALIGEAKATVRPRGAADLERLEHIRGLLAEQGHDSGQATLALFSLHGFHPDLQRTAAGRRDVLLVGLNTLYGDAPAG
ncbi:AAA family ATPase [Acrocarpospora catenulata]|uniref:AAA family ATPase n=1 Tax=Acrocarpospora catenulata TaxID=2836182 RepID=UPI002023A887|nr:ATP-binding protein [Acrocarpospora catenulata]